MAKTINYSILYDDRPSRKYRLLTFNPETFVLESEAKIIRSDESDSLSVAYILNKIDENGKCILDEIQDSIQLKKLTRIVKTS